MNIQEPKYPAFPITNWRGCSSDHEGMDLRDWFAGQVLLGMLACPTSVPKDNEQAARMAYSLAEAMMAERRRRGL